MNLITGNPAKKIFLFMLPLLLGNVFQQMYSMADTLIVGRTIGTPALAAVGSVAPISMLVIGGAIGITSGLTIAAAQHYGAGDIDGVRRSLVISAAVCIVMTVLLTVISVPQAGRILVLLRTPADIMTEAYDYLIVLFWGIGAAMLFNLFSNFLIAVGDSKVPLVFLAICCLLNIVLDYVFILVLRWGVAGAAYASMIASILSGVLCILYILMRKRELFPVKASFSFDRYEVWEHVRLGLPMGFQCSIIAFGAIILQYALNELGTIPVAAYTAAGKIDTITMMIFMSFGTTMATYTAQNYGAGRMDRVITGVRQCTVIVVAAAAVMGCVNIFAGGKLAALFLGNNQEAIRLSHQCLIIYGSLYAVVALIFVFRCTLQGLGNSKVPMIAGVIELVMRITGAVFLAELFGYTGICMSTPLAWIGACILLTIVLIKRLRKIKK